MKSDNAAKLKMNNEISHKLLLMMRNQLLDLIDLPFILVIGNNRHNDQLTYAQVIEKLPQHVDNFTTLEAIWGRKNPFLQPIGLAIAQIMLLKKRMLRNDINGTENIVSFSQDEDNFEFIRSLVFEIYAAFRSFNEESTNDESVSRTLKQ